MGKSKYRLDYIMSSDIPKPYLEINLGIYYICSASCKYNPCLILMSV